MTAPYSQAISPQASKCGANIARYCRAVFDASNRTHTRPPKTLETARGYRLCRFSEKLPTIYPTLKSLGTRNAARARCRECRSAYLPSRFRLKCSRSRLTCRCQHDSGITLSASQIRASLVPQASCRPHPSPVATLNRTVAHLANAGCYRCTPIMLFSRRTSSRS